MNKAKEERNKDEKKNDPRNKSGIRDVLDVHVIKKFIPRRA